jgi:lysyl-tRNA synthetase class 2
MGTQIEPQLGWDAPVFLYDYPASLGSLARLKPDDPEYSLRFELYAGGLELCNAFYELTDPKEQKTRFEKEMISRARLGKSLYPMPYKFLEALEYMPEAVGCAMGIDRLVMLFADTSTIDEVVAFPPESL